MGGTATGVGAWLAGGVIPWLCVALLLSAWDRLHAARTGLSLFAMRICVTLLVR
jgi:hypothetical protein